MRNYPFKTTHLHNQTYRIIPEGTSYWFLVHSEDELKTVQKKVNRIFKNPEEAIKTLHNYYLQLFKSKIEVNINGIVLKKGTYFYCQDTREGSGVFKVFGVFENEIKYRCPLFGIMDEIFEPKSFGKFLKAEQINEIRIHNQKLNN